MTRSFTINDILRERRVGEANCAKATAILEARLKELEATLRQVGEWVAAVEPKLPMPG